MRTHQHPKCAVRRARLVSKGLVGLQRGAWRGTPQAGRLMLIDFLIEINFLTVLEAGSPRAKCRPGQVLVRPLSLACGRLPSGWTLSWPLSCVSTSLVFSSSSHKDMSPVELGPTLVTSFNLNHLHRGSHWG